jgi:outer membrane protein assembly factor BamE (lipoprotein component of BamABCDE complex)
VGEPTKVNFQENDKEIWEYVYKKGNVKPASFIPIVGLFAGGANVEGNTLTIMFNKDGVVEKYGTGKTSGESWQYSPGEIYAIIAIDRQSFTKEELVGINSAGEVPKTIF